MGFKLWRWLLFTTWPSDQIVYNLAFLYPDCFCLSVVHCDTIQEHRALPLKWIKGTQATKTNSWSITFLIWRSQDLRMTLSLPKNVLGLINRLSSIEEQGQLIFWKVFTQLGQLLMIYRTLILCRAVSSVQCMLGVEPGKALCLKLEEPRGDNIREMTCC